MSPDIEDLLRGELRGAATEAPRHLGVDDKEVIARGRRLVVRRRVLTAAGVAAATLAIAGTIGVLAPRPSNDALPAIATPTVTPTLDPGPTATPTQLPSATATPSPTGSAIVGATPTSSPEASSTPAPSPSRTQPPRTPSSSPTPSSAPPWSDTITVAGKTHRARLEPVIDLTGKRNYDLVVQTDGREAWRWRALYPSDGIRGIDKTDPRRFMGFTRTRYVDLASIDGQPMTQERIGHLRLVDPPDMNDGEMLSFYVAVLAVPEPVGELSPYGPVGWVAENADGTTGPMDE